MIDIIILLYILSCYMTGLSANSQEDGCSLDDKVY